MKIQINDQRREFYNMFGTEQHITLACHPQSNGLCKRQSRNIKDSLVKALDGNPCDWPNIIEGVFLRIGLANILQ